MSSNSFRKLWNAGIGQRPYVTYGLLAVIIVVYILMMLTGGITNTNLLRWGIQDSALVQNGQYWRILTAIFIHLSPVHIVCNGISLFYMGMVTEPVLGHIKYFLLFMITGIFAGITSFALGSAGMSAGASGAIFGISASFLVMCVTYWQYNPQIHRVLWYFVGLIILNLIMDVSIPGISISDHLGGLFSGALITYILGLPNTKYHKILAILFTIVLIGSATTMLIVK